MFRTCPKLRLTLFQTVDIDKCQDSSLDLVIRGPVWSYPDQKPVPLWTLRLYLLDDDVVDDLVYCLFEIRYLETKVDVKDGSAEVAGFQIEQFIG